MADRGVLTGGARRRRWPRLIAGGLLGGVAVLGGILLLRVGDAGDGPADPGQVASGQRRAALSEGGGDASRFAVDLSRPDTVKLRFTRNPRAGLLFDMSSGRVLWRRNPTSRLPIASLTKMMTALIVVEGSDPHDRVKITERAVAVRGSKVGVLPKGRRVQLEALLNALLLVSGNDAAVALAQHTAGGVRNFVRRMNERAAELGLSCTRFSTPHGLRDRGNHSCAIDLAALARADLSRRRIRRIVRRDRAILKFPIRGGRLFLYNNNPLVRSGYRGVTGLKTGYTRKTGRSIVATAKRGRARLGVVLLRSYNPAGQARKLLDRGFRVLGRRR